MLYRIIILSACLILSACALPKGKWSESSATKIWEKNYVSSLSDDERIDLAKKRRSYITGIRKWDFYSLRNAPEEALTYYLGVQEKLPGDQVVRKKTANVYYIMKNWARAYREYIQVPQSELTPEEKTQLLNALFFDESTFDRLGELEKLSLSTGALDYYGIIDTCYTGIHNCIVSIEAYTWSESRIIDLTNQIKKAEKISPDYQYRNLLIAAKYYEQWIYSASEKLAREILKERPDYLEVKKVLALSLFELGKYEESKKYALEYLASNPRDMDSIIRLGEIYFHLSDYISSNLYLNNAITAWYSPKTDLERRLAYNYSLLGDTVGMMKVLNYLLQEPDVTEDDYAVAISTALRESQYVRAESWAREWLEKYRESYHLTPLFIRSLRLQWQLDNASSLIQNTSEEAMVENPNYLLEKAITFYELGDIESAKKLFSELLDLTDWPDIVEESRVYLARIQTL
jgi:hypothetical protein